MFNEFPTLFFLIMPKNVMLSLLAQGNTGAEILSILDAIVADNVAENADEISSEDVTEF